MPIVSDVSWRTPLRQVIAEQDAVTWRAAGHTVIAETIAGPPTPLAIIDLSPCPASGSKDARRSLQCKRAAFR
jgi:hypothetical protein